MADPITDPVWRLTYYFNAGIFGWSEEYYVSAGTGVLADILYPLSTFSRYRKSMLSTEANVVGIRVGQLNAAGVTIATQIFTDAARGIGPGLYFDALGMAKVGDGPLLGLTDATGKHRRSFILRGVPFSCAPWNKEGLTPTYPPLFLSPLEKFATGLTISDPNNTSFIGYAFRILGRLTDPTARNQQPIVGGSLNSDGCTVDLKVANITSGTPPGPYVVGSRIHVHGVRGENYKGISGEGVVTNVTPPATMGAPYIINVTNHPCCCGPVNLKVKGYIYMVLPAFYQITNAPIERTVHRNSGKPSGGTRGRRRKCSC